MMFTQTLSVGSRYTRLSRFSHTRLKTATTWKMMSKQISSWSRKATQEEYMKKDTCIVVNEKDEIIGNGTKKDVHIFKENQHGILHRAFSVFLFDKQNRLLLQKRSPAKFTFPEHWTNTCCSHQLFGFQPTEVDTTEDILNGTVPGVKKAVIRKLGHELGIPSEQLSISDFKYLTRLHYCASDVEKADQNWRWGEHEMDYILFIQKSVDLDVNPNEVCDHRYVDMSELRQMMAVDSGLKWTPWFRIIVKNFLERWWSDLPRVLSSDAYVDLRTIHRLDVT